MNIGAFVRFARSSIPMLMALPLLLSGSASAKDSKELIQKLNQNYIQHYQTAKSKNFDAQSLKQDTVSGYQAMNKETAQVRQKQFASISKKMYQQHEKDVKDGKYKKSKIAESDKEAVPKDNDTYTTVTGSASTKRNTTTGMAAGATQGAKVVTFGTSSKAADPTSKK